MNADFSRTLALLRHCLLYTSETFKIIAGGPMMGMAQYTCDIPVAKGTGAMLAFAADEDKTVEDPTCIRCGRCVEACPVHLEPLYMYMYAVSYTHLCPKGPRPFGGSAAVIQRTPLPRRLALARRRAKITRPA